MNERLDRSFFEACATATEHSYIEATPKEVKEQELEDRESQVQRDVKPSSVLIGSNADKHYKDYKSRMQSIRQFSSANLKSARSIVTKFFHRNRSKVHDKQVPKNDRSGSEGSGECLACPWNNSFMVSMATHRSETWAKEQPKVLRRAHSERRMTRSQHFHISIDRSPVGVKSYRQDASTQTSPDADATKCKSAYNTVTPIFGEDGRLVSFTF